MNKDQQIGIFGSLGLTVLSLCTGQILGVLFFGGCFAITSLSYLSGH